MLLHGKRFLLNIDVGIHNQQQNKSRSGNQQAFDFDVQHRHVKTMLFLLFFSQIFSKGRIDRFFSASPLLATIFGAR